MARKQFGMIDDGLLARVDARAAELGQTRRVFTERALEAALGNGETTARVTPSQRRSASPSASPRTPEAGAGLGKGYVKPIPKGAKR